MNMLLLTTLAKIAVVVGIIIESMGQARMSVMLAMFLFLGVLMTDVAWVRRPPSPNTDLRLVYAERPPELARLEAIRDVSQSPSRASAKR